ALDVGTVGALGVGAALRSTPRSVDLTALRRDVAECVCAAAVVRLAGELTVRGPLAGRRPVSATGAIYARAGAWPISCRWPVGDPT
ncbi:hypothetical protein IB244_31845, partial [Rhizobium sp. RHZ02]|uniref:hypothetical protein n=1 Tax=Rhizobium sp. RHZ02 TaxID=2769306 RepID=UPI00178504B2